MIYFIEAAGMVKIGHSNNPHKRLQMISTGCPSTCKLIGIGDGGEAEERGIHDRFSHLRRRGEWFELTDELMEFVNRVGSSHPLRRPRKGSDGYKSSHPLWIFLQKRGTSLASFAREAKTSRMQLYRIMDGESTTTTRLKLISEATKGELSVKDLIAGSRDGGRAA